MNEYIKINDSTGLSAVIHFRNLVEWINEGVFCVNSEGTIVYANRQFCRNLGYTETELIGRPIFEFFYDEKHAVLSQNKLELRKKGVSDVYDIKMKRKNGDGIWIRLNGKPIFNEAGQFVGSIAIHTDISKQKTLEEELMVAKEDLETKVITRTRQLSEVNQRLEREIREKKITEVSLKNSEKRFRDIFINSPDAIYVESYDGKILDVNDAASRLHGVTREDLIGKTVYDITPKALHEKVALRQPLITSGQVSNFESECLAADGSTIPIEISVSLIVFRDQPAMLMHVRDITERKSRQGLLQRLNDELEQKVKRRTHELEESNERLQQEIAEKEKAQSDLQRQKDFLRLILDSSPNMIYVKDADGKFLLANEAAARFYGMEQPEQMENHFDSEKQFSKEDLELFKQQDQEVLRTGKTLTFPEMSIIDFRSNEKLWLQTVKKPIPSLNGNANNILGVSTDITEIKEAKEKLFISEQLYREIARNLPKSAMFIFDRDLRYILAEGPLIGIISKPKNEIEGKEIADTIRESERERVESIYKRILDGESTELEQNFFGRSLKVYHIPIRNDAGEIIYGMVMVLDISDLKETQRELESRAAELQRSNEELERFAYVASHDLQSPLRTIASYLQLLEMRYKDSLDKEAQEFIEFSVSGARRMQTVIHELLNYARISANRKPFIKTDIQALVADVLKALESGIQTSGADVIVEPLPVINVDPNQVYQLFQNLIDNGIKFVKDKKPVIRVSATEHDDEWEFSVSDNGIGIKDEYRQKIFQIFQRLHAQADYPGSGVGLAICKKIVELHGGRIWFESAPDKGTTFYFTIKKPLIVEKQPPLAEQEV